MHRASQGLPKWIQFGTHMGQFWDHFSFILGHFPHPPSSTRQPYTKVVGGGRGRGKGPRFNFGGFEGPYTKVVGGGRGEKVHGSILGVLKGLTPRWLGEEEEGEEVHGSIFGGFEGPYTKVFGGG